MPGKNADITSLQLTVSRKTGHKFSPYAQQLENYNILLALKNVNHEKNKPLQRSLQISWQDVFVLWFGSYQHWATVLIVMGQYMYLFPTPVWS